MDEDKQNHAKPRQHHSKSKRPRQRDNARRRERYANDPEYRERTKAKNREQWSDDEFREKRNAKRRERYANDHEYREQTKALDHALWVANRERICARNRHRWATDPAYRQANWASHLKSRYGITIEDFNRLLEQQNRACAICERPFHETPHIDHCHLTHRVRGLLCGKCNRGIGHFDDNPDFLFKAALYTLRWYLYLLQVFNKEENNMTTTGDPGDENKTARVMRKAILHELHQPFGIDRPPPTDHLQAVARALVIKAAAHDVSAIKEVLDRIDGKTPAIPTLNDLSQLVNLSWKLPSSPAKMSESKKSKSTTGRAANSSPSSDESSGSSAS